MGNAEYMGTLLGTATSEKQPLNMNTFLFFSSLIAYTSASTVAVAPGTTLVGTVAAPAAAFRVRAPAHDSASIVHERLGGNFAYSTAEAHAYADVVPQISTITHPVAETTHTHIPAKIATFQPAPIVRTHHAAQPFFQDVPVHAQVPVTGAVRTHQTVHQPIVHETRTHTVQQVNHVSAAPVAAVHSAGHVVGAVNGLALHGAALVNGAHGLIHAYRENSFGCASQEGGGGEELKTIPPAPPGSA